MNKRALKIFEDEAIFLPEYARKELAAILIASTLTSMSMRSLAVQIDEESDTKEALEDSWGEQA